MSNAISVHKRGEQFGVSGCIAVIQPQNCPDMHDMRRCSVLQTSWGLEEGCAEEQEALQATMSWLGLAER